MLATFTVTSVLDSGAGSLRQAILDANATAAADVINFNMTGGTTINLSTALPIISQPLSINATTQPGYAGSPLVFLNGAAVPAGGNGFIVQASNSLIRGLLIGNFNDNAGSGGVGVAVSSSGPAVSNVSIEDCWIGTGLNSSLPNNRGVVSLVGNTTVRNCVISANELFGVRFNGGSNRIVDSMVGLRPTGGSGSAVNGGAGVLIDDGVFSKVENSIISGNAGWGVEVKSPATAVTIEGNIIGTNAARTSVVRNGSGAIFLDGSTGVIRNNRIANDLAANTIHVRNANGVLVEANNIGFGVNLASDFGSGTAINFSNVDSSTIRLNQIGHHTTGIKLTDSNANSIRNNGVGTLIDNSADIGNDAKGIHLVNSNDNNIGAGAEGNSISFNGTQGVHVESGERNPILFNRFRDNVGLDIDLGNAGVTGNDANDADTGANALQNTISPISFGAFNPVGSTQTTASFRFTNGNAGPGTYRVDYYRSDRVKDVFEIGEGTAYIGSTVITPSSQGDLIYYEELDIQPDGTLISATVTKLVNGVPTDTSEFSEVMRVNGAPQILRSSFEFETRHEIQFAFSRSVAASIDGTEISVRNLATNQIYIPDQLTQFFPNSVGWYFSTPLPDGNYRATLNRDGVSANVPLGPGSATMNAVGPNTIDFHVLAGDANRDRTVGFADLVELARNYNTTGNTFSQGNFDYSPDGLIGFSDLVLLARNYNISLPSAASVFSSRNPIGRFDPIKDSILS